MNTIETLMKALESKDFDSDIRKIVEQSDNAQLDQMALALTAKLDSIDDPEKRSSCVRGIQTIQAALSLREIFPITPNGKEK